MTPDQLMSNWYIGLAITAIVVVAAAALLLAILAVARKIEKGATVALETVNQIRDNTDVIWKLQETNRTAADLLAGAQSILSHAGQIVGAIHESEQRRGR